MHYENLLSFINTEFHYDLTGYNPVFVQNILSERMHDTENKSIDFYSKYLNENQEEFEIFLKHLQIKYSDFFRSNLTFALLEHTILPKIFMSKKLLSSQSIRIWSAGCSSGQEPYSLAMLIEDISRKYSRELDLRIFATDIDDEELDKAIKGEYSTNQLSNIKLKYLDQYFAKHGRNYTISNKIKAHIHFSSHNILDNRLISPPQSIFGGFDIVMCCNVLLYYKSSVQQSIINRFYSSMQSEGFLIVGDEEAGILGKNMGFDSFGLSSPIYVKK